MFRKYYYAQPWKHRWLKFMWLLGKWSNEEMLRRSRTYLSSLDPAGIPWRPVGKVAKLGLNLLHFRHRRWIPKKRQFVDRWCLTQQNRTLLSSLEAEKCVKIKFTLQNVLFVEYNSPKTENQKTLSHGKQLFLRLFILCFFRMKTLKLVLLFIFLH